MSEWIDLAIEKPANAELVRVKLDNGSIVTGQRMERNGLVGWVWKSENQDDADATATHWQTFAASPATSKDGEKT